LRAWGLGAKRELWTADTDALSLSAYTLLSRIGDAGWRQDTSRVALAYSHEGAGPLGWHVNLGHERDHRAGHGSTVWGLAGQYDGPAGLTPVLEAYGDDREPPWWNAGLRWRALPGRLQFDVAYGRQLSGSAPSLLTVGLKLSL